VPTSKRGKNASVIENLLGHPERFEFFQAVRLMIQYLGEHGILPEKALADHIRFANDLSMNFPPGQISALRLVDDDAASRHDYAAATPNAGSVRFQLTPAFLGLFGASGVMPLHYTERLLSFQGAARDEARAFLDIFSGRVVTLSFDAWRRYHFENTVNDQSDALLGMLLNLAGFGIATSNAGQQGIAAAAIAQHTGTTLSRPVSSIVLGRIMSRFFAVPLRIEEFSGGWLPLTISEQCSLGGKRARLGDKPILGSRSWRPDLGARVVIGPLDRKQFDSFLPGAPAAKSLSHLLKCYGDLTVKYEIKLILEASAVTRICLRSSGRAARLAQDCFLMSASATADRAATPFHVSPLGRLRPLSSC